MYPEKIIGVFLLVGSFVFIPNFSPLPATAHAEVKIAGKNSSYDKKIDEGKKLNDAGKFDEAIKIYTDAIKISPKDALAYNARGVAYRLRGNNRFEGKDKSGAMEDYRLALADFDKAIELNPNYAAAYSNRARSYAPVVDGTEKQLADLNKAAELEPGDAENYIDRADYYMDEISKLNLAEKPIPQNYLTQATDDFNRAIELEPSKAEYFFKRGDFYREIGNYNTAVEDLSRAIQLEKNHSPELEYFYCRRGEVYISLKDYQKALADFNKVIELNPKNPLAHLDIGYLYEEAGDKEKSEEYYQKAYALFKDESQRK